MATLTVKNNNINDDDVTSLTLRFCTKNYALKFKMPVPVSVVAISNTTFTLNKENFAHFA